MEVGCRDHGTAPMRIYLIVGFRDLWIHRNLMGFLELEPKHGNFELRKFGVPMCGLLKGTQFL